ncbi:diacylglycerol acyltransferase-domain-containing protein [Suillus lakei]|nr:diacylglycerol acyltransferase-domain-containing protein [Suillus lakei]
MDKGHDLTAFSRTISASSLRGQLTKLTGAPLRPVAALHASIDFVPTKIPRKRRLQMMVVAVWSVLIVMSCFVFLMLCSIPALWPFLVMYLVWIFCIDKSPAYGNRLAPWFRSLKIWQYFAEYYPASYFAPCHMCSMQECDLPADRPYVFGGALATFATEGESTGFSKAFPGIKPHLLTLTNNFHVPLYREVIMALGISSVSRESCSNILSSGPGQAITIVVGGAAESLSARPGTGRFNIEAQVSPDSSTLRTADLVPVFSFGENDIYNQMPNEKGTTIYALQKKFQNMFGFTLPLFHGRGLLNYNLGLMPYRRRIVSVIGRPIHVQRCEKPPVQRMYIEELTRIWNTYKDEFAKTRLRELSIVD